MPAGARVTYVPCAINPQIEIEEDLIEVSGGMCWHLFQLKFVKTPIGKDYVGRKTPKAFAQYHHVKSPNYHHFINTITNSFPDTNERLLFLTKSGLLFIFRVRINEVM